ncbi:FAD-dependent oxidoreductase [Nonomuraea roseoviolacea]|uniref:2-polyprenyl-6-methoxyphenol hydroxylase-like FAD-dependent oxidoreductase n=1 Tax=Nonomuraea roseoviolacea subsp. carminata TaxID=160689 RepID=A0ABT1K1V1_9ACTN|nr:NAD(P)/FAD-dependent oxidoreductase [Nonomuraea roseoviolacea]MCP2346984.1 2-polyprenyl-6-methoxyphenol hydroxylase-like FAD-dependent oxidoreductase [Nonomuraea roseoviolacea subsp. carminata]
MKVIVAGAGVGGLCLANALRGAGIEVSVHERDPAVGTRRQGYRLHLGDTGIEALSSALPAGRWAELLAGAHVPEPRFVRLDPSLNVLDVLEHGGRHLSVDRETLRRTLLAGVADAVTFGSRLTGFEIRPDRVTASFADGSAVTGDVLVGADGIGSAVRARYLPHARVVGTGLVQLYGKIPLGLADGMGNVFTAITGPGHRTVGVAPTRGYATCSFGARAEDLPPGLDLMTQEDLRALVLERTPGWHPRVHDMITRWREIMPLEVRTSVPLPPWPATRVTLLGDAVHAMSPAAGAGANVALRDATTLAAALAGCADPLEGVRAYEAEMTGYGFAAVRTSAANGARFLGQDPLPEEAAGVSTGSR